MSIWYIVIMSVLLGGVGGIQLYNQIGRRVDSMWSSYWMMYLLAWFLWIGQMAEL